MNITAQVVNRQASHTVVLKTGAHELSIPIPPKPDGYGSLASGGELLLLALATCYCNDLYREARKRGLTIDGVEVEVMGEFSEGEAAQNIRYRASVLSQSPKEKVYELMTYTDSIAEIQSTLRKSAEVALTQCEVRAEL